MPRSYEFLFSEIVKLKRNADQNFMVTCSYLEIYNEKIIDLLDPSSVELQLREDIKKGVYVQGVIEEQVHNNDDIVSIFRKGIRNRHISCTNMNKESSRSHAVLTLTIES